jgi:hypothetical protein
MIPEELRDAKNAKNDLFNKMEKRLAINQPEAPANLT